MKRTSYEEKDATSFILLHLRKSIPYTQAQVVQMCGMKKHRYQAIEHGISLPSNVEWLKFIYLYQSTKDDIDNLIKAKLSL